jgi:hypothetical protein
MVLTLLLGPQEVKGTAQHCWHINPISEATREIACETGMHTANPHRKQRTSNSGRRNKLRAYQIAHELTSNNRFASHPTMHRPTKNTRGLGSASNTRRSQQGRGGEDEAGRRGRVGNGHCGGAVLLGVGRVRVLTVRSVGWGHDGRLGRGRGRGVRRRLGLLLLGCSGSGRRRGVLRCGGRRWYVGVGGWPRRGGRRAAE